ncbi:MAG: hypothetical protein M3Y28_01845 [Armatimonadota bacterium]|nr:hypothetical protein [Armatimonadota bacterium]
MTILRSVGLVPALLLLTVTAASAAGPLKGDYTGQYRGAHVTLRLGPGATYRMLAPDKSVLVQGTYTATRQNVAFQDTTGPISDKAKGPGKYHWMMKGGTLTLKAIADALSGRKECLTGTPWMRTPAPR